MSLLPLKTLHIHYMLPPRHRCRPACAQVITGSHDKTIRLWDIRKPATMATLTYHKKSVRALAMHPSECAPLTQSLCTHARHCLG